MITLSLLEIFEKVNLVIPLEQRRFFNYFEDSVNELSAMYEGFGKVLEEGTEFIAPRSLTDEITVLPLYAGAIADNIVFLAGGGEAYKSEFIRKSRDAYLKYWNDNAKGKRIKCREW